MPLLQLLLTACKDAQLCYLLLYHCVPRLYCMHNRMEQIQPGFAPQVLWEYGASFVMSCMCRTYSLGHQNECADLKRITESGQQEIQLEDQ